MSTISKKMREINSLAKTNPQSLPMSDDWKRGAAWVIGQLREIMEGMPNRYCAQYNPMDEFREVYEELGDLMPDVNPQRIEQLVEYYKGADLLERNRVLAVAHMIIMSGKK